MVKKGSTKLINRSTLSYFVLESSINIDLLIILAFVYLVIHKISQGALKFLPEEIFKRVLNNNRKLTASDLAPIMVELEKLGDAFKKTKGLQSQKKKTANPMEDIQEQMGMLEMINNFAPLLNTLVGSGGNPTAPPPTSPVQVPEITK